MATAISFAPRVARRLGMVKGAVVQAALAPFPTPSQFDEWAWSGVDWLAIDLHGNGIQRCPLVIQAGNAEVAGRPGVASREKASVARGNSLSAP